MSNQLRGMRKGDKSPAVRMEQFRDVVRKVEQIEMALVNNIYEDRNISLRLSMFVQFLIEKGVVKEADYREFLQVQQNKMNKAQEIRDNVELSREQKISMAKEQGIPESWVVEPEAQPEAAPAAESAKQAEEPRRIIIPGE